jgi:hypothetical protein
MSPEERAAAAHAGLSVRGYTADGRDVRVIADAIREAEAGASSAAVVNERGRCARLLERVLEEALEVGTCGPMCEVHCEAFGCSTLRDLVTEIREGREP